MNSANGNDNGLGKTEREMFEDGIVLRALQECMQSGIKDPINWDFVSVVASSIGAGLFSPEFCKRICIKLLKSKPDRSKILKRRKYSNSEEQEINERYEVKVSDLRKLNPPMDNSFSSSILNYRMQACQKFRVVHTRYVTERLDPDFCTQNVADFCERNGILFDKPKTPQQIISEKNERLAKNHRNVSSEQQSSSPLKLEQGSKDMDKKM